jgi:hypothetical protein
MSDSRSSASFIPRVTNSPSDAPEPEKSKVANPIPLQQMVEAYF